MFINKGIEDIYKLNILMRYYNIVKDINLKKYIIERMCDILNIEYDDYIDYKCYKYNKRNIRGRIMYGNLLKIEKLYNYNDYIFIFNNGNKNREVIINRNSKIESRLFKKYELNIEDKDKLLLLNKINEEKSDIEKNYKEDMMKRMREDLSDIIDEYDYCKGLRKNCKEINKDEIDNSINICMKWFRWNEKEIEGKEFISYVNKLEELSKKLVNVLNIDIEDNVSDFCGPYRALSIKPSEYNYGEMDCTKENRFFYTLYKDKRCYNSELYRNVCNIRSRGMFNGDILIKVNI